MRIAIVTFLLTAAAFSTAEEGWPVGDLNRDFKVDLEDLEIFAGQWLEHSGCEGIYCAEIDSLSGVTLSDFALLAGHWLADHTRLPLRINEFAASLNSDSGISDPQGQYDDWIEIYNFGDMAIDLAGMYLTDDLDDPTAWRFPEDRPAETTIDSNGYLIVWADGDVLDSPGLHAGFSLSAGGEEIGLFDSDGATRIDSIVFGSQMTNLSYGRWPNGGEDWRFFAVPTPGAVNDGAYLGLVADTKFSHTRGFYEAPFSLSITCQTPDAEIYYTTDGSAPIEDDVPTAAGIRYTGPISIGATTCIRAAAIKTGWMPTNIDTQTYLFDAGAAVKAMPVISIVGDAEQSLYEPEGVMAIVGGYYSNEVWQSGGAGTYNNPVQRGRDFERPVSFEWIDLQTGAAMQEDCGIRVRGSDYTRPRYTRGEDWTTCWNGWPGWNTNKFGFNLWFRSEYGQTRFEYPLFPFIDVDRFKSIVLRSGHNDACTPFVKDEWTRRLFCEMGWPQVTGNFVNLYINGVFRGYYNPTARGDEEFYQEWYETENAFDVITHAGVRDGDNVAWNHLLNYANSRNLADTAEYEYVAARLDIPAFIDYLILQIYIGNFDWPGNNWDAHRERTEGGKFRFSIWDAEGLAETWIFGSNGESMYKTAFEDFPDWSNPRGLNNLSWDPTSQLYRALRDNAEFRQLFTDHIHRHFRNDGVLTQAHLLAKWWEVFAEVSGVLPATSQFPVRYVPDTFIPARQPYVLAAFESNNLFDADFGYPIFHINGSDQHGGYVSSGDVLTITQSTASGTLYFTIDGSDPRLPAASLVAENAPKKVLVPTGPIAAAWRGGSEPYDDSGWTAGAGGIGYERGSGYENRIGLDVEAAMYNINTTCYIRIPFTVDGASLAGYNALTLRIRYDDGFAAYLNGTEVRRANAPSTLSWNAAASGGHEASESWDSYDITAHLGALQVGENILAIHGLNTPSTSSDFLICAELVAARAGGLSPSAIEYTGGFPLTHSIPLRSRIRSSAGQWSALNEAVFAVGPVAEYLRIAELMYHPDDPNDEFIELVNVGAESVNLNRVRFTRGVNFSFGPEELAPGERILVVSNQASFLQRYPSFTGRIAGSYEGKLDNAGEKICLRDALHTIIHEFTYKDGWYPITDGEDFSLTIRDASAGDRGLWNSKDGWRPSAIAGGSPGVDDAGLVPDPGSVVINELLAHSHGSESDWVELHNTTDQSIHIGGWFLSDSTGSEESIKKYEIPLGTSIPAGGYLVFSEDLHFGNPQAPGISSPFAFSEGGESVYLRSGLGGVIGGYEVSETFGASASGVAFGRHVRSELHGGTSFVAMSVNTPGAANAYPLVGPLVISEIMYHPSATNTGGEYIEMKNITGSPLTLQEAVSTEISPGVFVTETVSWRFSDGIDFVFPADTTIPAGGLLILTEDPAAFTAYYGPMPAGVSVLGPFENGTQLSNGGERVEIVRPGDLEYGNPRYWIRAERLTYDDETPWPPSPDGGGDSLHHKSPDTSGVNYSNDVINWQAAPPGPGQ